ncbi:DUF1850 domain-containing protein [Salinicoccus sp. ID82-1]|uniref:DUF1850 domain-containing protein n=1 Tax=Salinicoccus sp. ID82-1 TaxID=2820269 RepID=UPI001F262C41|nr:DUF1850 domain-containing protein [Salinicoccus sp. ID82-1]
MVVRDIKKTLQRRNVFLALVGLIIIAVILLYILRPEYMVISDMETDEVLYSAAVEEGERFAVTYIHSVERSPVKEVFEVRGTDVYTMESHTESFGAGMPYEGDEVEMKDGVFIIRNINRRVHGGVLRIRPSSVFPHHIQVGDDRITLSEAPYKGRNLEVKVIRTYFGR